VVVILKSCRCARTAFFSVCLNRPSPPQFSPLSLHERSSDLGLGQGPLLRPRDQGAEVACRLARDARRLRRRPDAARDAHPEAARSEEHTSELQSPDHLVCRLLLEKKNKTNQKTNNEQVDERK